MSDNNDKLTVPGGGVVVPADVADLIDPTDAEGYDQEQGGFPIIRPRVEPLLEGREIIYPGGGFEFKKGARPDLPAPLLVTIIVAPMTRAYWPKNSDETDPICRSLDGVIGEGNPGGHCVSCEYAQWTKKAASDYKATVRPECTEARNLICYCHATGEVYNYRIQRTGLSPWKAYIRELRENSSPSLFPHLVITEITSEYVPKEGARAAYRKPVFTFSEVLDREMILKFKEMRKEMSSVVIEEDAPDDEDNCPI